MEACWWFPRRSSSRSRRQVVRPRKRIGDRCWGFLAGVGCSSTVPPDLDGYVWRSPACSGGGFLALDCVIYFCVRVFIVNFEALSSNIRFLRASEAKGPLCKCTRHFMNG
jgi:hypothetical protein